MRLNGLQVTPTVHEPNGIIVLVSFPNGDFKMKAELLPEGLELDHAIAMLEVSLEKLHQQRAEEALKDGATLRAAGSMPTFAEK